MKLTRSLFFTLVILISIFTLTTFSFISPYHLYAIGHINQTYQIGNILKVGYLNNDIIQVIYLNNELAVDPLGPLGPYGHAAVILKRADGSGVYYSFGIKEPNWIKTALITFNISVDGKVDVENLTKEELNNFMNGSSGILPSEDKYSRYIAISVDKDKGNAMFNHAQEMSIRNLDYNLYGNNCNHFVQQILRVANLSFTPEGYDWFSGARIAGSEELGVRMSTEDKERLGVMPNDAYNTGVNQWSVYKGFDYGVLTEYTPISIIDKAESVISNLSEATVNYFTGIDIINPPEVQSEDNNQQSIVTKVDSNKENEETIIQIPLLSKPYITSPYNWYQSLGGAPTLIWKGDENSVSYYVIVNSSNTGDIKSGWISSTSWKPTLPNENYIYSWKVKAKNSQGVESEWSESRNFSVASTTLISPPSPSSADMIKIFASTTGWGGVGVILRVSVNTATDGSSNGEWKILKELGVPKFNEIDAPEWHTNGWSNGTYRIRVEAKGPNDPNWQNPAVAETTYTLVNKKFVVSDNSQNILNETITNNVGGFNPSFEIGSRNFPDGWQIMAHSGATFIWDKNVARSGNCSFCISNLLGNTSADVGTSEFLPINHDSNFIMAVWVKGPNNLEPYIAIDFYNSDGNRIEPGFMAYGKVSNDWSQIVTPIPPENIWADTVKVKIYFGVNNPGGNDGSCIWFDDVYFGK